MKKTIKIYAAIRLISLAFMGIVYAAQGHEDFIDEVTDHRHIMVVPTNTIEDEFKQNTPSQFSPSTNFKEQNKHPVRVLSLGGGGARGVGSAEILCVLEAYIYRATGKKLHEFFDVIVGTSTGGIQAIGLGMGLPATELRDLYQTETRQIFKQNGWGQWLFGGIWGPTYSTNGLRETIEKHMGHKTLSEVKTHVAVTVYDDRNERAHLLTNQMPGEGPIDYARTDLPAGNLNIIDAAEATAAAPTYFAKKIISEGDFLGNQNSSSAAHHYVDGGITANDPAALAKTFAQRLLKKGAFDEFYSNEIQLVSIGTGHEDPIVFNDNAGIFGFGSPGNIPSYFMNGAEAAVHALLAEEMQEGENYFHVQFSLPHKIPLDTVDEKVLNLVVQRAHAATETDYFNKMVEVLCEKSISEILNFSAQNKVPQLLRTQTPLEPMIPIKRGQFIEVAA
ncbi:hypothetical protein IM40_07525 [Candidatus Paracaedimonas acanthamoebae]|nr:hypothetical protein IM40_07525 [Candidatus Paracaedimonas acanthamoebae]